MRRHGSIAVLGAILALSAPGVASAQRTAPAAASIVTRSDDTIRIGCSGGVTGAGSGNTITRSGALSAYHEALGEPATHSALRHDSAAAAAVFRELDRVRFRTLRFDGIGNMTCVLELADSAGAHSVSWQIGQPPAELEPVLAALGRAFGDDRRMWR